MSYILDALRRADAERERGVVPSLQSQQHTVVEEDDAAVPRSRLLLWVIVGLGGALLALLAWTLLGGGDDAAAAGGRRVGGAGRGGADASAVASAREVVAPVTADAVPAPPPAAVTAVVPAPVAPVPRQSRRYLPRRRAADGRNDRAAPHDASRRHRSGSDGSGDTPAASTPRIYAQGELPEDVRRDLPRIAINGSSYSGDAASRMVMINGQIFHEGDSLGAGLVLEKINRRSAVLAFRGWRYEVAF